jgi:hypothetical protein
LTLASIAKSTDHRQRGDGVPEQTERGPAGSLLRDGRVDEALRLLLSEHDSLPQDLAHVYVLRGNWDKAELHARSWVSAEPASGAARLLHVIVLTVLGRGVDAALEAQLATAADPGSALAWAAAAYCGLPARDPRKGARPDVERSWQAARRCAELDHDGLLSQALHMLIAFAANDPAPPFPSATRAADPSVVDAIRWLATAEHSLGFDATALVLYQVLLLIDPGDRLAMARAVQIARANTTFTGLLVSNPWMIAALPAQLGIGNLYLYLRGIGFRQYLPRQVALTLRTEILWRRAHSVVRPLLGAMLCSGAGYWIYRGQVESSYGKSFAGQAVLCAGLWLLGSWAYARWRLRRRQGLADLSPGLIDLVRRDTLPLKARAFTWPLAASILAGLGIFFFAMGFTAAVEDRPLGLVAGPVMFGVSLWVATRWLLLHWRLRHPAKLSARRDRARRRGRVDA